MADAPHRIPLPEVRDLLQIGQPMPFRVLDRQDRLLLNAGHVLADEVQFASLVERGAWAERPLVEAERAAQAAAARRNTQAPELSLFDQWEKLVWQFDKLSRALVRRETPGNGINAFLATLQQLVDADPDVALFLCVRQDDRRFALYALTHSLHCAVLALLVGRQLGWQQSRVASLACSALSMNLSIFELQATMAEQDTPPSAKQLREIRAHPAATVALLRASGVLDEEWLATVADHHEQPGGGGYPAGLSEVRDSPQVLRAIDVFMAKISPRNKRPALTPDVAVRQLFQQRPGDPLAMAIIKTIGLHPPGSLLQLRSGEVAVAIRRPVSGTHPLVATLSDRQGRPAAETHRRDTAQAEFGIQGPLLDGRAFPRVVPERVYGVIRSDGAQPKTPAP
jgi:HD-GYP domain-containing protein (c-di-GMP phosphodiesterase class II)